VADGNASPLFEILSKRRIPVVITTGDEVNLGQPALNKAAVIRQKPHADSDLIAAIVEWAAAPHHRGSLMDAPFVPVVRRQRGSPSAAYARLQSRQFSARWPRRSRSRNSR
jgi:hypothetical protein